jgi:hypothetical protein
MAFQLTCSRVAQKSYPQDLSGKHTRALCYGDGEPERNAPPRIMRLYEQRERFIEAIDTGLGEVSREELRNSARRLLGLTQSMRHDAVEATDESIQNTFIQVFATMRDAPGIAELWAKWNQSALLEAEDQRLKGENRLNWIDLTWGDVEFSRWFFESMSRLQPSWNGHASDGDSLALGKHQLHGDMWETSLNILREPELMSSLSEVGISWWAAYQEALEGLSAEERQALSGGGAALSGGNWDFGGVQRLRDLAFQQQLQGLSMAYRLYSPYLTGLVSEWSTLLAQRGPQKWGEAWASTPSEQFWQSLRRVSVVGNGLSATADFLLTDEGTAFLQKSLIPMMRAPDDPSAAGLTVWLRLLRDLHEPFVSAVQEVALSGNADAQRVQVYIPDGSVWFLQALAGDVPTTFRWVEGSAPTHRRAYQVASEMLQRSLSEDAAEWNEEGQLVVYLPQAMAMAELWHDADGDARWMLFGASGKEHVAALSGSVQALEEKGYLGHWAVFLRSLLDGGEELEPMAQLLVGLEPLWEHWSKAGWTAAIARLLERYDVSNLVADLWLQFCQMNRALEDGICYQKAAEYWPGESLEHIARYVGQWSKPTAKAWSAVLAVRYEEKSQKWAFSDAAVDAVVVRGLSAAPRILAGSSASSESSVGGAMFLQHLWSSSLYRVFNADFMAQSGEQVAYPPLAWVKRLAGEHRPVVAQTAQALARMLQEQDGMEPIVQAFQGWQRLSSNGSQNSEAFASFWRMLNEKDFHLLSRILHGFLSRDSVSHQRHLHIVCDALAQVARNNPQSQQPINEKDLKEGLFMSLIHLARDPVHGLPRVMEIISSSQEASSAAF